MCPFFHYTSGQRIVISLVLFPCSRCMECRCPTVDFVAVAIWITTKRGCGCYTHKRKNRILILTTKKYPDIAPFLGSNPMGGFLPVVLLLLLLPSAGMMVAWTAAIALFVIIGGVLFFRRESKHRQPAIFTSLAVLLLLLPTIWLPEASSLVGIGSILTAILLVSAAVGLLRGSGAKEANYTDCPHKRLVMLEYGRITGSILRISLFFLFLMGLLLYFRGERIAHVLLYLPGVSLFLLYVYEVIRLEWVRREMRREEWIPITDTQGESIGRIARSETEALADPAAGLLPVVRLIAISDGMIYLSHYCKCDLCTGDCYDTPFFSWLTTDKHHKELAQSLIDERFCGVNRLRPHFLLRYIHNENGKDRLVYLYLAHMSEPNMILCDKDPRVGKWWPVDQIEEQLSGLTFGPYLRSEMPYLRQTVLLAEQLKNHHE